MLDVGVVNEYVVAVHDADVPQPVLNVYPSWVNTDASPKLHATPSEHTTDALVVPDVPWIVPEPPFLFNVIVRLQSDFWSWAVYAVPDAA